MKKNISVYAFTPIVHLGSPAQNAAEIIRCMGTAKNSGEAICVFPAFCLCGATLGSLMLHEDLRAAVKQAVFDICEETSNTDLHIFLGTYSVRKGVIIQNTTYISAGKIQKVFKSSEEVTLFGVKLLSKYATAKPLGKGKLADMLCAVSQGGAVAYASSGYGESTTDTVPEGLCAVAENGKILACNDGVFGVDYGILRENSYVYAVVSTQKEVCNPKYTEPKKPMSRTPFLPQNVCDYDTFAHDIFNIQVAALLRRMRHIGTKQLVCALSGGLDSALALLVCKGAMKALELPEKNILAITMPCFGTTGRTFNNALGLMEALGATCKTIDIKRSVEQHFCDMKHLNTDYSVVFENAQARERTQVGLDLANKTGGIFVGTGDLSELMLGFTTYGGDHMSMYGINCGLPKTIVRFVTEYLAKQAMFEHESEFLLDILRTPISPELLPPDDDTMSQKTESILGSYDLHDFSIYYLLQGVSTKQIYKHACALFAGTYSDSEIKSSLQILIGRFFSQQFKRSCAPDGVAPLGVSVSPRGGLIMPSDALKSTWEVV